MIHRTATALADGRGTKDVGRVRGTVMAGDAWDHS